MPKAPFFQLQSLLLASLGSRSGCYLLAAALLVGLSGCGREVPYVAPDEVAEADALPELGTAEDTAEGAESDPTTAESVQDAEPKDAEPKDASDTQTSDGPPPFFENAAPTEELPTVEAETPAAPPATDQPLAWESVGNQKEQPKGEAARLFGGLTDQQAPAPAPVQEKESEPAEDEDLFGSLLGGGESKQSEQSPPPKVSQAEQPSAQPQVKPEPTTTPKATTPEATPPEATEESLFAGVPPAGGDRYGASTEADLPPLDLPPLDLPPLETSPSDDEQDAPAEKLPSQAAAPQEVAEVTLPFGFPEEEPEPPSEPDPEPVAPPELTAQQDQPAKEVYDPLPWELPPEKEEEDTETAETELAAKEPAPSELTQPYEQPESEPLEPASPAAPSLPQVEPLPAIAVAGANTRHQAWLLGGKLALAQLADAVGATPVEVGQWRGESARLAKALRVSLPESAGDQAKLGARVSTLLNASAEAGDLLAKQYDSEHAALMEVALKTNTLLILCEKYPQLAAPTSRAVESAAKRAKLPGYLWEASVSTLANETDPDALLDAVAELHAAVEPYLR